jgi:hypothetical protein
MARKVKAEVADWIWDLLERNPGGLPAKMICHYLDITNSQLRSGLDYIRDLFQEDRDQPIITAWVGGEYVYVLTDDKVARRAYAIRRKKAQLKAAKRDEKNANAAHLKWPEDPRIENEALRCRLHRVTLEEALSHLEAA